MDIVNTFSLECNRRLKINFEGGELSSVAGCLLLREFIGKLGFDKLMLREFKTTDSASFRFHTDSKNLLQMIYQIICGYFTDDCADELTNDPVLTAALGKGALASQPTISRFFSRMDEATLKQFGQITRQLRRRVYTLKKPELVCWIWILRFWIPTENRKARDFTIITRAMDIIRWSATME